MSELQDYFRRLRNGELDVNQGHPEYGVLSVALSKYNAETAGSDIVPPSAEAELLNSISIAVMQGVIKPSGAYLEKLAREIKEKKITEQDVDRVEGSSEQKKTMKEKILNKLGDKALGQLVAEISLAIKNHGLSFLSIIEKAIGNSNFTVS